MRMTLIRVLLLGSLIAVASVARAATATPSVPSRPSAVSLTKPNIIFLLADDLGYGDIGAFGQKKIRTPHLDQLARDGMKFTHHYSGHNVCAPSRCVLMTGKHPGHAYIRNNRGGQGLGGVAGPEGQEPVPPGELKLPLTLKKLGYATGGFGKWGLGGVGTTGDPNDQGMDRFFGYNDQAIAHNFYPTSLWNNRERVPLRNAAFAANQKLPDGADPKNPASYASFTGTDYAPDFINEAARKFLRDHQDRPFFLYLALTAPHDPLMAWPEDIDKWGSPLRVIIGASDPTTQIVRSMPVVRNFADIGGGIGLVVDSYGMLALCVDRGSASAELQLGPTDLVVIAQDPSAGAGVATSVRLGTKK